MVPEGTAHGRAAPPLSASGLLAAALLLGAAPAARAQPPTDAAFDLHRPTAQLVERGTQALLVCNGLFVSRRPLDLIYDQELKLDQMVVLPPWEMTIDETARTVAVGTAANDPVPTMRAAYREGFGCIALAPGQTFADALALPALTRPAAHADPSTLDWPDGDRANGRPIPAEVDQAALARASDWTFDRERHGQRSQITLSLLVVYRGQIVHERYAPGVDATTRTRTWSTAKSIASTLIGIRVGEGKLGLDEPLRFDDWGPSTGRDDPRHAVTLRHLLHMSSGLYPVDNERCAVVGSCLGYWAGQSTVRGALDRGLVRAPGTRWDYENYDTLLAVRALERTFPDRASYHAYPYGALLDRIGMRSTLLGIDRFGHFVLSSQVFTNARDLARLGLLYLNDGRWHGQQVLPAAWVRFARTPAPATRAADVPPGGRFGGHYGGHWWLVPDGRSDVPPDAYSTAGNRGQYTIVVPSHDLVVVRRGLDYLPARHPFSQWDLLREVLAAFPRRPWGKKPAATEGG